jgi:hypothetical protein
MLGAEVDVDDVAFQKQWIECGAVDCASAGFAMQATDFDIQFVGHGLVKHLVWNVKTEVPLAGDVCGGELDGCN